MISGVYCSQLTAGECVFSVCPRYELIFCKIAEFNVAEFGVIK